MKGAKARLAKTTSIPFPNPYVQLLLTSFKESAFDETLSPTFKGKWRTEVFSKEKEHPLDVEIGTGNGLFFSHKASTEKDRLFLGIEAKYKPLIQAIKKALEDSPGGDWFKILRYNAYQISDLFEEDEINNVYIHHPDPWPKKKHWKHRLLQSEFMESLFKLQKKNSFVDFKTDSEDYFDWTLKKWENSPYEVTRFTRDLHNSEWEPENFITHFEKIFLKKKQPIFYLRAEKK